MIVFRREQRGDIVHVVRRNECRERRDIDRCANVVVRSFIHDRPADRRVAEAVTCALDLEAWRLVSRWTQPVRFRRLGAVDLSRHHVGRMQAGRMGRVDLPFQNLCPVAAHPHFGGADARIRRRRECRRFEFAHLLRWTHIDPHKTARLARRIGLVLHAIGNEAVFGFGRHLHHVAIDVEFPAVIEAAQPALFVTRKHQRGAPVRAILVEDADTAFAVAEHHKILAQQAHLHRRAVRLSRFLGQAGCNPVAAHDPAHRGVARDAAQQVVFLWRHHGGISPGGCCVADFSRAPLLRYLR